MNERIGPLVAVIGGASCSEVKATIGAEGGRLLASAGGGGVTGTLR